MCGLIVLCVTEFFGMGGRSLCVRCWGFQWVLRVPMGFLSRVLVLRLLSLLASGCTQVSRVYLHAWEQATPLGVIISLYFACVGAAS